MAPVFISAAKAARFIIRGVSAVRFTSYVKVGLFASLFFRMADDKFWNFCCPAIRSFCPLLFVSRLPYTVHALTDAKLCTFALKEITDQAHISREATRRIEIVCATGLVDGEARLAEINQRNSQERTAWLLLSLFHELKRRGYAEGDVVPFPLGLAHIADALGITITHASRTLGTLRREGLISLARERLTVHNRHDLANVALLPMAATGE